MPGTYHGQGRGLLSMLVHAKGLPDAGDPSLPGCMGAMARFGSCDEAYLYEYANSRGALAAETWG